MDVDGTEALPPASVHHDKHGRPEKSSRPLLGIAVLAALEAGGRTDREIAEAVGCDRSYVTILRLQTGAARTPGKPGPAPRIDARRLDAMLAAGISQARAARYLGVTGPAISMHLRRRKRAGEVSPAGPSIPDTTPHHSLTETDPVKHCTLTSPV